MSKKNTCRRRAAGLAVAILVIGIVPYAEAKACRTRKRKGAYFPMIL